MRAAWWRWPAFHCPVSGSASYCPSSPTTNWGGAPARPARGARAVGRALAFCSPASLTSTVAAAIACAVAHLTADLLARVLDPRIPYGQATGGHAGGPARAARPKQKTDVARGAGAPP